MESFADGADVSNANEFDDETIKEEQVKDDMKNNSLADSEPPVDYQTQNKMDAANSQENNDAVEDCINLNLEDEENFDEVNIFLSSIFISFPIIKIFVIALIK